MTDDPPIPVVESTLDIGDDDDAAVDVDRVSQIDVDVDRFELVTEVREGYGTDGGFWTNVEW